MKRFLFFASILIVVANLFAAPHNGTIFSLKQPDGSRVDVKGFGDEFYMRFETPDGYTLVRDSTTGWLCYANLNADSSAFVSTGTIYSLRNVQSSPAHLKHNGKDIQKELKINHDARVKIVEKMKRKLTQDIVNPQSAPGTSSGSTSSSTTSIAMAPRVGNVLGLTIIIDFSDDPATVSRQEIVNYCNQSGYNTYGNNGSVHDYFSDVSGGKLNYTNTVTQYYRASHPKSYYTDRTVSMPIRAMQLISEALSNLDAQGFDFSTLSTNNNKVVLAFNVFYAGMIDNDWAEGLWPHKYQTNFSADGVTVSAYQISNIGRSLALRTFCHENGHMLMGWPDLYDYGDESNGVGNFCLMCSGANNLNPAQPCVYLRWMSGWDDAVEIPQRAYGTTYSAVVNSHVAFKYTNPLRSDEFFMIENLNNSGRNAAIPGSGGLGIWHIDEIGSNDVEAMTPLNHYQVSLEQADGLFQLEAVSTGNYGGASDLFTQSSNNTFHDFAIPGAKWWRGQPSGFHVSDIGPAGNSINFTIKARPFENVMKWAFDETHGGDAWQWSSTWQSGGTTISTATLSGNLPIVTLDNTYDGSNSLMFDFNHNGTGTAGGAITTSLTLQGGDPVSQADRDAGKDVSGYTYLKFFMRNSRSITSDNVMMQLKDANGNLSNPVLLAAITPVSYMVWHPVTIPLSSFSNALCNLRNIVSVNVNIPAGTPAGMWKLYFDNIAFTTNSGTEVNVSPVSVASYSGRTQVNSQITLDGRKSFDPNSFETQLSYSWTQTSGTAVSLSSTTADQVTFTPVTKGACNFRLDVNDGEFTGSSNVEVYVDTVLFVTTEARPVGGGTVTGAGSYTMGTRISPAATPASGYRFDHWEGDFSGAENPIFRMYTTSDMHLIAVFVRVKEILVKLPVSSATASSSENASTGAAAAIDNNSTTTRWSSSFSDPQWITFDMGSAVSVTTAVFDWESANAKDYRLEGSNDPSFATKFPLISKVNMSTGSHRIDSLFPLTGSYRYYRLTGTSRNTAYGYSIWEARFYTTTYSPIYTITASASANGSITPSGSMIVNQGDSRIFTVTPNSGYQVGAVNVDNVSQGSITTYTFSNVTANHTISALFVPLPTYTLTTAVSPVSGGEVSGNANTYVTGATATITANAFPGYVFSAWSGDYTGTSNTASIVMNGNKSVTALFTYQPALVKQTPSASSASASESGATLPGAALDNNTSTRWSSPFSDPQWIMFDMGSPKSITTVVFDWETANARNYTLEGSNDVSFATKVILKTLTNMGQQNHRIDSLNNFTNQGSYRYYRMYGTARNTTYGYSIYEARFYSSGSSQTYTLTTASSPAAGGSVSSNPAGGIHDAGSVVTLTARANVGFRFLGWSGDLSTTNSTETITMGGNKSVTAHFEAVEMPKYTVTATAGANGSISPEGVVSTNVGTARTFTMVPNAGYRVLGLAVDGSYAGTATTYTFPAMTTGSHTISVSFTIPNQAPVANAGPDQNATVNNIVTLDGSGSYDPDNYPQRASVAYLWSQTSGSNVTLSSNAIAKPTFTPTVAGTYQFSLRVDDGELQSNLDLVTITVPGNGIAVPGRIQAEDYKIGGEGVGYHDLTAGNTGGAYKPNDNVDIETTSDVNGIYNVGWTDNGEWLAYDINVAQAGSYKITARLASGQAGTKTLSMTLDGNPLTTISTSVSSGWQVWSDVSSGNFSLTAGAHVLRVTTSGGLNLNYFEVATITTSNLITNGDFANSGTGWTAAGTTFGTVSYSAGTADWSITSGSGQVYEPQMVQGVSLVSGRQYTVCFDIRTDESARNIDLGVNGDADNNWANRGLSQSVPVTTSWTRPSYTFTANATDATSRLDFNLGANANDVTIDNVSLVEGTTCN